ncbi:hypothetical protein ACQV5M_21945, partial [Leptospira sp. SA-E8]|uniref:hypothetical protein n=1 Tax=Leptospira sp. SA-E8 TaxID=3422259 RepID=UPI003EB73212
LAAVGSDGACWIELARARLDIGDEDGARVLLDRAAALPLDREQVIALQGARIALIDALIEDQRRAEARALLDAHADGLLAAVPDLSADQAADLISVQIALGDRRRAWQTIDAAPASPRTLIYAARLAEQEGRLDEAIAYRQRALA